MLCLYSDGSDYPKLNMATPDKSTKKKKGTVDFKYNLKVYLSFLLKYKWLFLLVLLLCLVNEAMSTADKFLFKVIIDNGAEFAAGTLGQSVFIKILIIVACVFGAVLITKSVTKWIYLHLSNVLDSRLMRDLKIRYFNHIIHLSHGFHVSHRTGSLISRVIRGGHAVETMTDVILAHGAPLVFQIIVVGISLAIFNWVTAVVLVLMVVSFIGYSLWIQQKQRPYNIEYNRMEDIEKGNISDVFMNVDSVKYFGKEELVKRNFARITNNTKKSLMAYWDYYRWLESGQIFILGLGTFFLIYFPIMSFLNGEITLGTLVFIYTVYTNLLGPMFSFVWGMRNYYRAMADFEDLFQYGKIENDIKDKENAKKLNIKKGEVEFNSVEFSYHKRKILSDLSLNIKSGEKVALVGPSGSGKTTLVKLLYRFYDVDNGEIKIDDKNIKEFQQESLREELSIVPQECILFDDTLYNNIAFSNPKATREEIFKAMKFAQLDKFIENLPDKENTIVGERGVKLSGGEKQRVSIARAILADKRVLVLDEATSSLDSQTEHEIQLGLEKLMKGRTALIIAHRLSTIMKADKIVVMDKGKIVQVGTHQTLIKKGGLYRKLWNLQKGGYLKD